MKMKGTPFQKLVWRQLLSIPRGEIRTYKQIADSIGKPSASRAVANACAKNPYAPYVPCHRAIRSDGSIGGYSGRGGQERKLSMLLEEGYKSSKINDKYS